MEVACFLRHCLFTSTDQAILMVQRRVADLWRMVAAGVTETVNWADLYKTFLAELAGLVAQGELQDAELRARIVALISAGQQGKPPSRWCASVCLTPYVPCAWSGVRIWIQRCGLHP